MDVYPEGKITDPKYRWIADLDLEQKIQNSDLLPENKTLIGNFVRDARIGKTILKGTKKRIGKARLIKYFQDLKKLDTELKKPLDKATDQDIEKFILSLEEGTLKQHNGKPYAPETQVAIKKIIIKFYKWLNGGKTAPDIVTWIDTSYQIKDYPTLSKEEVDNILRLLISNTTQELIRNKAIIAALYDSGARIDEMLNARIKHLTLDNGNYKLRIEFSKTKARTIILSLCKSYLDEWLDVHPLRDNPLAQLFPITQSAISKMIKRAGNKIGKKLTPHGLRHASATYWARYLTQWQMNYRFGWSMNSKQPARYIDRSGINQDTIATVVETNNIQKLTHENAELNRRVALMEEQLERLMKADKEELLKIIAHCQQADEKKNGA